MKKVLSSAVAFGLAALVGGQAVEAGSWQLHPTAGPMEGWQDQPGGGISVTVWPTYNCQPILPAILEEELIEFGGSGSIPIPPTWKGTPVNDVLVRKVCMCGIPGCDCPDIWRKYVFPRWDPAQGVWVLDNVSESIDAGPVRTLPHVATEIALPEPNELYILVDLNQWDDRPITPGPYMITNGESPDLPGYLIGTTPIVFEPGAPEIGYPLSTTPFNGTLQQLGDVTFQASGADMYEIGDLFLEYGTGVDHEHVDYGLCPPPGEVLDPGTGIDLQPEDTVSWREVYPSDGAAWTMSRHPGNPGGLLQPGDDIRMHDGSNFNSYYVVDVTITIWVTRKLPDIVETLALELSPEGWPGYDSIDEVMSNPLWPVPARWHQIWPPQQWCTIYNTVWYEDNNLPGISCSDQIGLTRKPDGFKEAYHIDAVTTDIILQKKAPPVPQKRTATWSYLDKGYVIDYYVYTNSEQGLLHIAQTDLKMESGDGRSIRNYQVPFPPDDLFIKYHWQNQEGVSYYKKILIGAKGGPFKWSWDKILIPTENLLACQNPDGTETFCLISSEFVPEDAPTVCQEACVTPYEDELVRYDLQGDFLFPPAPTVCCLPDFTCEAEISVDMCEYLGGTSQDKYLTCGDPGACLCGNGQIDSGEQCDGVDDDVCPGQCQDDCTCFPGSKIPTVSEWGLIVLTLLGLTFGTIMLARRRERQVAGTA